MVGGSSERRRPATAAAASSATELHLHHRQRQCRYLLTSITLMVKNIRGWCMWTLVSPDGVAPSWMVGVSASVNLPLHHRVQKFSSGTI